MKQKRIRASHSFSRSVFDAANTLLDCFSLDWPHQCQGDSLRLMELFIYCLKGEGHIFPSQKNKPREVQGKEKVQVLMVGLLILIGVLLPRCQLTIHFLIFLPPKPTACPCHMIPAYTDSASLETEYYFQLAALGSL